MPLFQFRCDSETCQHEWEELVMRKNSTKTDWEHDQCPACGNDAATRLFPRSSTFILVGSGWSDDGYSNGVPKDSQEGS